MPYRKTPLVVNQLYHIFNRSIARQPIFKTARDYQRMMQIIDYYRYPKPPLRFSFFNRLSLDKKEAFMKKLTTTKTPMLEIISYSLMPNHFHFLLRPLVAKGISDFVRNIQHSYSKYFNVKNDRSGSLFQGMFKAVLIETENQLVHVIRYIDLNPVTAHFIEIDELENYQWVSFSDHVGKSSRFSFVSTQYIMEHFKSGLNYKKFVFDQADYQRELGRIKHLILE